MNAGRWVRAAVSFTATVALLGAAVPAAAQTSSVVAAPSAGDGRLSVAAAEGVRGVSVTPALMETVVNPRAVSLHFVVANNEPFAIDVNVTLQQLQQSLDGTLDYRDNVPGLIAEPATLSLASGAHAPVRVHGALPAGTPAMYAGLLVEPHRARLASHIAGGIQVRTRVASVLLLTTAGRHARGLQVQDVTLTPTDGERTFRVSAVLRNVGAVHERPQGTVTLSEPGGPVLGVAQLRGGVLLPGAARRLDGGTWTAAPATERVVADTAITDPATHDTRSIRVPTWSDDAARGPWALRPNGGLPMLGGQDYGAGGFGGGGVGGGVPWLVWLALALLLAMTAALTEYARRTRRPHRTSTGPHPAC